LRRAYRRQRARDKAALQMLAKAAGLTLCMLFACTPSAIARGDPGFSERIAAFDAARQPASPVMLAQEGEATESPDADGADDAAGAGGTEAAKEGVDAPLPTILRSESDLPEPVRVTRAALMQAARSGDLERLRALMEAQAEPPSVAFGDPGDPIEYLKQLSADADGREILAILLEVLESGFAHVPASGEEPEFYVWPYFAQYPLEALTAEQIVELFTLLTAADFEDMKSYGAYTFFRVGIALDGRWLFFVAGD
jgi:hypothetical protein